MTFYNRITIDAKIDNILKDYVDIHIFCTVFIFIAFKIQVQC